MNVIHDNAWSILNCFYYVVSYIFFGIFMIDSGNKQVIYSSCVVFMVFKFSLEACEIS